MANKENTFTQKILDRIISGEFRDNVYLPCERDLVNEYGISRVTVRNGLKKLVARHVLRPDARKGYMVLNIPEIPVNDKLNIGGLWCSGPFSQHTIDLYHSAETVAEERSFHLFLKHSPDDEFQQAAHLADLLEEKTQGLLIVPTYSRKNHQMSIGNHALLSTILRSGIPLVMVDRDFPETDLPCVVNDEYVGGKTAAEHLAGLGHQKVMLLCCEYNYYVAHRRFTGFTDRCKELGMEVTAFQIPDAADAQSHVQEIVKLLADSRCSAVMINHIHAEWLWQKIRKSGLDLDFLLYDGKAEDFPGEHVWCVERPLEDIAAVAMDLLMDEISRQGRGPYHQIRLRPIIRYGQKKVD